MIRLILKFHLASSFEMRIILREYFSSEISEIETETFMVNLRRKISGRFLWQIVYVPINSVIDIFHQSAKVSSKKNGVRNEFISCSVPSQNSNYIYILKTYNLYHMLLRTSLYLRPWKSIKPLLRRDKESTH